jgi:hypothetical protein
MNTGESFTKDFTADTYVPHLSSYSYSHHRDYHMWLGTLVILLKNVKNENPQAGSCSMCCIAKTCAVYLSASSGGMQHAWKRAL